MLTKWILAVYSLGAGVAYGQSVSNTIAPNEQLTITYGDGARQIHAPGALMHPGYMATAPNISTPSYPASGDGLIIMLDLDAPFENSRVSSLHWLASVSAPASPPSPDSPANLTITTTRMAYEPPYPPTGDTPHTYAFFLVAPAPANLNVPEQRTPFDVAAFMQSNGLSENTVVARNHFRVQNLTGTPSGVFPPARASETASGLGGASALPSATSAVFEGRSGKMGVGIVGVALGVLVGLVV